MMSLLIRTAVFLFPIMVATVSHGGGMVFVLLFLIGLVFGCSELQLLDDFEKRVLFGFLIFFVLVCLSMFNADDFLQGMSRVEKYLHFALLFPMYLLMRKYRVETGRSFLYGILVSSAVMLGQSYFQTSVLGWNRAVGAYNPLIIGDVSMLVVIVIICGLLTVAENWRHYLIGVFTAGMALATSVLSGSRGAWVLLPVAAMWFLWIKRKNLRAIPLILILVLGTLLVLGGLSIDRVKSRVNVAVTQYQDYFNGSTEMNSVAARLEMWRDSIDIWTSHPIIGTGLKDFEIDRYQLFIDGKSHLRTKYGHAHNIYFDVLATTGLVGFFGMLVLIQILPFRMFYSFWVKESDPWIRFYSLSGMTTIIAFAVFGVTEAWLLRNSFVRTYLMCILVFMSSIMVIKAREADSDTSTKIPVPQNVD